MAYTSRTGSNAEDHHTEVSATSARQGRWGQHVLWVLLAGLALVFIALFGTWASRSGDLASVDARSRAVAEEGPQTSAALLPAKQEETDQVVMPGPTK
ncbi:MAG TPA: hypothetical protein VD906_01630 [Caulobacteraceae bacterium]|nr:hypothetical protein [Caulobacteraceae bacterium]